MLDLYRDIEDDLATLLDPRFAQVYHKMPPDIASLVPAIRVTRIGGSDDLVTDVPRVSVDVFAATAAQAKLLARQIQAFLLGTPWPLDRIRTEVGPQLLDLQDLGAVCAAATYTVSARRAI